MKAWGKIKGKDRIEIIKKQAEKVNMKKRKKNKT